MVDLMPDAMNNFLHCFQLTNEKKKQLSMIMLQMKPHQIELFKIGFNLQISAQINTKTLPNDHEIRSSHILGRTVKVLFIQIVLSLF